MAGRRKEPPEDTRSIRLENAGELDGLPEDFIASHPPDEEGTIVVTTDYPDLFPVLQYAHREDVRRRLSWEHLNRGYPINMEVLDQLLARRAGFVGSSEGLDARQWILTGGTWAILELPPSWWLRGRMARIPRFHVLPT